MSTAAILKDDTPLHYILPPDTTGFKSGLHILLVNIEKTLDLKSFVKSKDILSVNQISQTQIEKGLLEQNKYLLKSSQAESTVHVYIVSE